MSGAIDLLIVGAGPAGLAAAIQAGRDGLDSALWSEEPAGGLVRAAHRIDNLPGFAGGISGEALADRMCEQAARFGITANRGRVISVRRSDGEYLAAILAPSGENHAIRSRCVLLATGTVPRHYPLFIQSGLERVMHRDVRSLPTDLGRCRVAAIGGGEAALDSALSAVDRGASVTLMARGCDLKAPPRLIDEAAAAGVDVRTDTVVTAIEEDSGSVVLAALTGGCGTRVSADHIVLAIGREPRRELFDGLLNSPQDGGAVETLARGLYLAGDVIRQDDRFVATAIGDGQRAARLASAVNREEVESFAARD